MAESNKIAPTKGRPMLHWVGKTAPKVVQSFPAQLVESFGVAEPLVNPTWKNLEKNWYNLLLHGDNKEILSTLIVNGFRGKIDLIYIDPPFDSKANYVRKVSLRGHKDKALDGENPSLLEEMQYEDIWANDTYLQYMYERLVLLRELLSEKGSIYLHCDWHKSHHLRFLMDEVFGENNFINEIIWCYVGAGQIKFGFNKKHDTLLFYKKTKEYPLFNWKDVSVPYETLPITSQWRIGHTDREEAIKRANKKMEEGRMQYDWWTDIPSYATATRSPDRTNFPTEKPTTLLERIIKASSDEDSVVLDCFCGSGTTAAVAERLGRRWIAADMNIGAVQTTVKRMLKVADKNEKSQPSLGFAQYRVNNYDFKSQNGLKELITKKYGVEPTPSDFFFDGVTSEGLVKIAPLNRPLSAKDVEDILQELDNRPDEERNITLVGYGSENSVYQKTEERNRSAIINKIVVNDIQRDNFYTFERAQAEVEFETQGDSMRIEIKNFISPTILKRLKIDRSIFDESIDDFRAQIDCIFFDSNYDGKNFRIAEKDIPEKKSDLIKGKYIIKIPNSNACVAVKIIDMLGEEVFLYSKK